MTMQLSYSIIFCTENILLLTTTKVLLIGPLGSFAYPYEQILILYGAEV